MDSYSLIVVTDETAPIRRYDIRRRVIHNGLVALAVFALLGTAGVIDWVGLRIEYPRFLALEAEAEENRAKIAEFEDELAVMVEKLEKVKDLERKVRIIANLPGAAGTGGADIVEAAGEEIGDLEISPLVSQDLGPESGLGGDDEEPALDAADLDPGEHASVLREEAVKLGVVAEGQELSLKDLLDQLESKQDHLASSPAIWPTKGWLTSRFGYRTSPFTAKKQFHSGIDIAGRRGTEVIAPARGRVVFAKKKGPLGNTVKIDHGYGITTLYGHLDSMEVKRGQTVQRGQVIAALGNTGRSTGPHLHYTVEVEGKAVNPLDYIFD